ncbi:MAG TPA: hypothetical protein VK603_14265 [Candidatus Saccharimonadales bacterium]|nr:hypothetical protein [Candidatus Saccharimonadales bacterium]
MSVLGAEENALGRKTNGSLNEAEPFHLPSLTRRNGRHKVIHGAIFARLPRFLGFNPPISSDLSPRGQFVSSPHDPISLEIKYRRELPH